MNNEKFILKALRGAITCDENSSEDIEKSVNELINELIKRNNLEAENILSLIFSVTKDLDACFPAAIARKQKGWEEVVLLDCQQMFVKGDLKHCIRILAHVWLPYAQEPNHTYLGLASTLRPDR